MNIPTHLLKHEDRILYNDDKWLILDGIDRHGDKIEEDLITCIYYGYGYWVSKRMAKEVWNNEKDSFWQWLRSRTARQIVLMRNKEIAEFPFTY